MSPLAKFEGWSANPKYLLAVKERGKFCIFLESRVDRAGFYVLATTPDFAAKHGWILANTGFRRASLAALELDLPMGAFIIMPCAYAAGQGGGVQDHHF